MGFVCGAEDEQWLNPVRQDHQTELLFILCEAQDGAWHWTQSRQATRGLHTYPFLCVCVCLYRFLLCWIPRILTHQLARTALRMLCSGSNEILQPTLWPVKSQRGCEVLRCEAIMCCSRSQSIAWRHLAWLAEAQLIM